MDDSPQSRPEVVLVGANPILSLFDASGAVRFFVSAWRVDWSPVGAGSTLVVWHDGQVHTYGSAALAPWLERDFTRHFPEVSGLPWPEAVFHESEVEVQIDLGTGLKLTSEDLALSLSDIRDRRVFHTDDFPLAGRPHGLTLVLAPCFEFAGTWSRHPLSGRLITGGEPGRPTSSAFVTEAEVWTAPVA